MRTTPLRQWEKQGTEFDEMVRDAASRILGRPLNERAFVQAALTPKLGGLGLRKSTEHAGFAYSASWHEARVQSGEEWGKPAQVSDVHVEQSAASYEFDEAMHAYLVDSAPDDREKQRLLRVARPHSGSFVTAVPSEEDGQDCLLKPRLYRTAVAYRLGLPVLNNEIPCPLCMQPINVYGDHATCCAKNGDIVIRHNSLRNLVYSIASDGLLQPLLEKQGILGPTSGRRPGDVTIPDWKHNNGLAIDVAVTSPLTKTNVRLVSPCENYSETQKHRKYDASFEGTNYYFCAMVFETLGGVNTQGEKVLRQLFTFASKQLGREFSSYCSRAWARVSCCLQRSVAQVILNRVDGKEGDDGPELPAESFARVTELLPVGPVGKPVGEPLTVEPLMSEKGWPVSKQVSRVSEPASPPRGPPPEIPPFPFKAGQVSQGLAGGEVKIERRKGRRRLNTPRSKKNHQMEDGSGRNKNGRERSSSPSYSCAHTSPQSITIPSTSSGDLPKPVGVMPADLTAPARRVRGSSSAR